MVTFQASLSMESSRQDWSGLSFPSPGDLLDPGIEPRSPTLQADTLPFEPPREALKNLSGQFSLSVVSNSLRPHELQHAGLPVHRQVMPSSHLILCRPLLLLPLIPPSIIVFSNESTLRMRWPKYWSFILSISPSR